METEQITEEQVEILKIINGYIEKAKSKVSEQKAATQSFVMTSKYVMQHANPAIIAGDTVLVNPGELLTLVALPGTGKTQLCEALASAYAVAYHRLEDIDTLQLRVFSQPDMRCLYIDTERPHDDNYKSFERIIRRLHADTNSSLLLPAGELCAIDYRCFVSLADTQQLKDELERLCSENQYGLILIDGALDFVGSMNNEEECSSMVKWLRALANSQGAAIAVTLHPNKGSDTMAGHLGAMLYRYSRACLVVKPHENNSDIKILTNIFSQSKLSHGGPEVSIPFGWDEASRMMLSLPDEAAPVPTRTKVNRQAIAELFNNYAISGKFWVASSEVKADYAERFNKPDRTAKDHIAYAYQQGWLEKKGENKLTEYRYASEQNEQ